MLRMAIVQSIGDRVKCQGSWELRSTFTNQLSLSSYVMVSSNRRRRWVRVITVVSCPFHDLSTYLAWSCSCLDDLKVSSSRAHESGLASVNFVTVVVSSMICRLF